MFKPDGRLSIIGKLYNLKLICEHNYHQVMMMQNVIYRDLMCKHYEQTSENDTMLRQFYNIQHSHYVKLYEKHDAKSDEIISRIVGSVDVNMKLIRYEDGMGGTINVSTPFLVFER